MTDRPMTRAERQDFLRRMRTPLYGFAALMLLLGTNVLLGAITPFHGVWIAEALVLAVMVAVVLLFSMEILHEPPLVRLFSVLGFCWVGILFAMTLIDYLTR